MSELKKRIASSVFLMVLCLSLYSLFGFLDFYEQTFAMYLIIATMVVRASYEWTSLTAAIDRGMDYPILRYVMPILAGALFTLLFAMPLYGLSSLMIYAVFIVFFVSLLFVINIFVRRVNFLPQMNDITQQIEIPRNCHQWGLHFFGIFYLSLAGIGFMLFWQLPAGSKTTIWMIAFVIIADSMAFFGGKRWGKRKLCPSISPGKTWAGFFTSLISVLLVYIIFGLFFANYALPLNATYSFLVLSVFLLSVFGDLFISILKRRSGLKDVARLIPGHGGLLDRLDGHIMVFSFLSPMAFWLA